MNLMSKEASTKIVKFIGPGSWSLVLEWEISSHVVNLKFLSPGLRLSVLRVVVLGSYCEYVLFTIGHLAGKFYLL